MSSSNEGSNEPTADSSWRGLYISGGIAALVAALVFRRFCGTELITFNGLGLFDVPASMPVSAQGWFTLFHDDPLTGLLLFDTVDLINYALLGLIFLALFGALRKTARSTMIVATTIGIVGVAVYFASNQAFSMLSISNRYAESAASASTEASEALYLPAGEALLAIHNPGTLQQGTGIYLSFTLVVLAGLLISIVMLRSTVFNKATAVSGILANLIALGYVPVLLLASTIAWFPPAVSAPFRIVWYILIALRLFRLAKR